jgi:hypothetical protein
MTVLSAISGWSTRRLDFVMGYSQADIYTNHVYVEFSKGWGSGDTRCVHGIKKFDSITDDESTDSDQAASQVETRAETSFVTTQDSSSCDQDDENGVDAGNEVEWWAAVPTSSSSSKHKAGKRNNKKKKRKRNKKKSKSVFVVQKNLCLGNVHIQEYDRCLGIDVVPLDGSWPLGIGEPRVVKDTTVTVTELVPVDQYETQKQVRLRDRLSKLDQSVDVDLVERLKRHETLETLETRQMDYRSGVKNPLFHLITEENRMELLLKYSEAEAADSPSHHKHKSSRHGAGDLLERFNDVFTKVDIAHFRVQLEDIRAMRSIRDATGCSCHRLRVYIPPENVVGGKTAQKKRLAINKVKSELRKRNLLPKDDHAHSRERIGRYLLGTWYKGFLVWSDAHQSHECYADAQYCGNWYPMYSEDPLAKGRTEYVLMYRGYAILWASRLRSAFALIVREFKYVALSTDWRGVILVMHLLKEFQDQGDDVGDTLSIKCQLFEHHSGVFEQARTAKSRPNFIKFQSLAR